jgi:hypothetical protein
MKPNVIPGLYAIGNTSASMMGASYPIIEALVLPIA